MMSGYVAWAYESALVVCTLYKPTGSVSIFPGSVGETPPGDTLPALPRQQSKVRQGTGDLTDIHVCEFPPPLYGTVPELAL